MEDRRDDMSPQDRPPLMHDRHPGLVRVLRIAREAYGMVPVGEALAVELRQAGGCRSVDLVVRSAGRPLITERFSGMAVAMAFRDAITWLLDRWRGRRRSHDSVRATATEETPWRR